MVEFGFTAKILLNLPIKPSGPKEFHLFTQVHSLQMELAQSKTSNTEKARVKPGFASLIWRVRVVKALTTRSLGGGGGGAKKGPQRRIFSVT